jgi:hypothetical protein
MPDWNSRYRSFESRRSSSAVEKLEVRRLLAAAELFTTLPNVSENNQAADFGAIDAAPASISGQVWNDRNANGVRDAGERPIVNVQVQLVDDAAVQRTTSTSSGGQYAFADLPVDVPYRVRFLTPSSHWLTLQDQGTDDTRDSDADPQTGFTASTTLTPGQALANVDAGMYPRSKIEGTVFRDVHGDGQLDRDDPGLPDWTAFIDGIHRR